MPTASKILVSACLLGNKVRFDGNDKFCDNERLRQLIAAERVIAVCPEVAGGLPVPRLPAEIQQAAGADVLRGTAQVNDQAGTNVTAEFVRGAQVALQLAQQHNIRIAILKERSPSCGHREIYDGSFAKHLRPGAGVTAALLSQHGIRVFGESEIEAALDALEGPNAQIIL